IEGAIAERIIRHGPAKIIGHSNIPARIPRTASELFARNILNFLTPLYDQEKATLKLNFEDEIIKHTLLTHEGKILHPDFIQSDQTAKITEPKAHPIDETSLQEQTTNHNP
ncbi:MAG: NAD(P)(+) transhydrogenase (Re/Si-specific) subunit alpha, partial [Pseudomonadota bacterium]